MSTAKRIEDFIAEIDGLSDDEFEEQYPYPFLVKEATEGGEPEATSGRGTTRLKTPSAVIGGGLLQGDVVLHGVCPKDPENFDDAVSLGRNDACDLVVADGSISSKHAHFTLQFEGDEKTFFVTDLGSSNGTFVNGEKIEPNVPVQVDDQDSIRFGPAVKFQFFQSEGFYQFLQFYKRMKK